MWRIVIKVVATVLVVAMMLLVEYYGDKESAAGNKKACLGFCIIEVIYFLALVGIWL